MASGGSATGGAATIEPTAEPKEIVTVTPFSGLWKYYGQKRTFIRDVHYAVSDEKDLPDGVTLTISSLPPHSYDKHEFHKPEHFLPADKKFSVSHHCFFHPLTQTAVFRRSPTKS